MPKVPKAPKRDRATDEVLDIPMARVRLSDASLTFEPETVEYEKDGEKKSFERDPGLNAKVNIVEVIVGDKSHEAKSFWQRWKMKWSSEQEQWEVRGGTSYGNLVEARYGKGILDPEDPRDLILEEEDFENFEIHATIVPKKNPQTDQELGSMLKWDGVYAIESKDSKAAQAAQAANDADSDELADEAEKKKTREKVGV